MTKARSITFIVPTYNSAVTLDRCLESIRRQNYDPKLIELIVLDNGSSDDTIEIAHRYNSALRQIPAVNISKLRNVGADLASSELLAFIDSDCEIDPGWTWLALEVLESQGAVAVGSPNLYSMQTSLVGRIINAQAVNFSGTRLYKWVPSAALLVNRETFLGLNGFDQKLKTCEDVDFGYRLNRSGFKLAANLGLTPKHHGDPATLNALLRKEYWRSSDSLILLSKHPTELREYLSNLYQIWFYLMLLLLLAAICCGSAVMAVLAVALFFIPVFAFSFRAWAQQDSKQSIKEICSYFATYYFARSFALFRGLDRLRSYYSSVDQTG